MLVKEIKHLAYSLNRLPLLFKTFVRAYLKAKMLESPHLVLMLTKGVGWPNEISLIEKFSDSGRRSVRHVHRFCNRCSQQKTTATYVVIFCPNV